MKNKMSKLLLLVVSIALAFQLYYMEALASENEVYYVKKGGPENPAAIMKYNLNDQSEVVVISEKVQGLQVAGDEFNSPFHSSFMIETPSETVSDNERMLFSPYYQVEKFEDSIYYTKVDYRVTYFGPGCGGGGSQVLSLYKLDPNGKSKLLVDGEISSNANGFAVHNEAIYYLKLGKNPNPFNRFLLYKSDLNGNAKELVLENVDNFWISNDELYYLSSEDWYVYRSSLNGENAERVTLVSEKLYGPNGCSEGDYMLVDNGMIYLTYDEDGESVFYYVDFIKDERYELPDSIYDLYQFVAVDMDESTLIIREQFELKSYSLKTHEKETIDKEVGNVLKVDTENNIVVYKTFDQNVHATKYDSTKSHNTSNRVTPVSVQMNGNPLSLDQPAVVKDGRTLVPLRGIFEALGATVQWNGETRIITAVKGDIELTLPLNSNEAYKNNTTLQLQVPASVMNGRTLVPLRFVSEAFGANVAWEKDTKTVLIQSNN